MKLSMWRVIIIGCAVCLTAACEQPIGRTITGLHSLAVNLKVPGPDQRGTTDNPISVSEVEFDLRALDADGQVYDDDFDVDVYVTFGGARIGVLTPCGNDKDPQPLTRVRLQNGVALGQRARIERVFGRVTLWFEEVPRPGRTTLLYGASPEMVFRSPTIPDVQLPLDLNSPTATYCTPFSGKQVTISKATGNGQLVVTSVYPNAYVVADTGAPLDRQTLTGGFNHIYVFTFGRPPFFVEPGRVLARVGGNVTKFVGFTELSFPYQDPSSANNLVQVPPPFVLVAGDRGRHTFLLRLSSATVQTTARVCPIDVNSDDWKRFNQFTIHFNDGVCDSFNTFQVGLPTKIFGTFDPLANRNRTITVVGVLRNFSGQNDVQPKTACSTNSDCVSAGFPTATCVENSCKRAPFNFWTILPRDPSDITVN